MFPSLRPSERMALVAAVDPASQSTGAPAVTPWIKADGFFNYFALIQSGVLGASGTLDAKLEQATDGAGAGAKAVPGKAITQLVKATGDGKQAMIELAPDELDISAGFKWFRLSVTTGTAAGLASAAVFGVDPRYAPPSQAASVAQVAR
jgi:hypothetical protein